MSDQNDAVKIAGEWTKQLGLWASGTIVLSLTFLKDFVKGASVSTCWRVWLLTTWLCLILSLLFGHLAFGAPLTGAGRKPDWKLQVNTETRVLSILQLSFFLLGLVGMVTFAANHLASGSGSEAASSGPLWEPIGCIGPFLAGSADHIESAASQFPHEKCQTPEWIAERIRKACTDRIKCLIILVGSADRRPLRESLEREIGGNEGLARARADWVLEQLAVALALKRESFLVLTAGPSKHGRNIILEDIGSDRSVTVLAAARQVQIPCVESAPRGEP